MRFGRWSGIGVLCVSVGFAAAQDKPEGWAAESAAGDPVETPTAEPLSENEQARYDAVCRALVEAINARDQESYRALFSERGWESSMEWWRNMFAEQIEVYGRIDKAWAPSRGIAQAGKVGAGNDWGGAAFLIHFEEPAGGVLSLRLDDDGKIDRTDVFVTRGLGYQEPEGVEVIYRRSGG